jgi:tyrosine aminotransferase
VNFNLSYSTRDTRQLRRKMSDSKQWNLSESKRAKATFNPIRTIVDQLNIPKAPEDKHMIPLSLGDPSFFGNLPPPPNVIDAICEATRAGKYNGYAPAHGTPAARTAIATKYTLEENKLTPNDIIIASGCSDSLKILIHSVVGEGEKMLVPEPGFGLYVTLTHNNYGGTIGYPLLAERQWECDLEAMESLVDDQTKVSS